MSDDRRTVVVVSPYGTEYGPTRVLENVVEALTEAEYRLVCAVPPGATVTLEIERHGPQIRYVQGLSTFPRTVNVARLARFLRNHLRATRAIERIATEEGAELVYSTSEAIFCGGLAARRARIASLVHVIGMSIKSPRWVASVYIRLLGGVTDLFVACSSAVADMLSEFGVPDQRIAVVHNGISTKLIDAAGGAQPLATPGPNIGMVAAYDPRKGHELFVEAAARIGRAFPDARFYIIGGVLRSQPDSIEFERHVRRRIAALELTDRFVATGYVAPPQVYRWIRAMDVVVVPSRTEAFAHALLEAMACGKAVVATGIEGNLDALVDGHSGVYVPRTPGVLADVVCGLLRNPERAAAMGKAARKRVSELFDLSVTLPALADAVDELIGGASSRAPRSSATASDRTFER